MRAAKELLAGSGKQPRALVVHSVPATDCGELALDCGQVVVITEAKAGERLWTGRPQALHTANAKAADVAPRAADPAGVRGIPTDCRGDVGQPRAIILGRGPAGHIGVTLASLHNIYYMREGQRSSWGWLTAIARHNGNKHSQADRQPQRRGSLFSLAFVQLTASHSGWYPAKA